jgi:hypothetical protein
MTTTAFKIDLMLLAMGIKRFMSHSRTPTTIRTTTILIKGMIWPPSLHKQTRAGIGTNFLVDPKMNAASVERSETRNIWMVQAEGTSIVSRFSFSASPRRGC